MSPVKDSWAFDAPIDLGVDLVPRPRALRTAARLVGVAFLLAFLALWLAPWQQSVRGGGRMIAYAPLERQQEIEAPISGRVVLWHVQEGELVTPGQRIATMEDNDPAFGDRLGRARDAATERLASARQAVRVYGDQIAALVAARLSAIDGAARRVDMAVERLRAAERAYDIAISAKRANDLNLERQRLLETDGLSSVRNRELAELAAETASAEVDRATATMRAAKGEIAAFRAERDRTDAATTAEVERARASLESARMEVARHEGELQDREVAVSRQAQMEILAPRAGTVLRQIAKQGGEYLSAGDPVAVLVPDTAARAAEIWLDGRDAPLVTRGRKVRLQFEGWPAVQFVGWPSVAVGTFGGEVAFVDAAADSKGRFRAVVVPDPLEAEPWPDGRFLRQGTAVNGWVLLDRVRLGYELWRQWNGFPASTTPPPEEPGKATAGLKGRKDVP